MPVIRHRNSNQNRIHAPKHVDNNDLSLTNAPVHLHTTSSHLNAGSQNIILAALEEIRKELNMFRQELNESRQELKAPRQELNTFRQEMNAFRHEVRDRFGRLEEIMISTAVEHAKDINRNRQDGVISFMLVRFPNGELPARPRPLLRSLAVINRLQLRTARSYARAYRLAVPKNATVAQLRDAIAVHIGAKW